jgi:hypothetical protein
LATVGRQYVYLLEVGFSAHEVYEGETDDPVVLAASDPKTAVALGRGELLERGLLLEHSRGTCQPTKRAAASRSILGRTSRSSMQAGWMVKEAGHARSDG